MFKVLVVERDRKTAGRLAALLREHGVTPVLAADSAELNERIDREKFDGVIFDWSFPGLPGAQLTQRIRRSPSNGSVPLVCLTNRNRADLMGEASSDRVPFYLLKPFEQNDLKRLMNACHDALMVEHCRYLRVPLRVGLTCAWAGSLAAGETVNISSTGVRMKLEVAPPKGAPVSLRMDVPGLDGQLEMKAVVTRSRNRREVGARFVKPSRRGLAPLLRLAHQEAGRPARIACGIERRSYQAPGLVGSSPGSGDHPHRPPLSSRLGPVRILIVEDDPQAREVLASVLERPGWEFGFARDQPMGVLKLKQAPWHLVLAGISGETVSGPLLDAVKELDARGKDPPQVLGLIPSSGHAEVREALKKKGIPYLIKPVQLPALLQGVSEILIRSGVLQDPLWSPDARRNESG